MSDLAELVEVPVGVLDSWRTATLAVVIQTLTAGVSVNANNRTITAGEFGVLKTSCVSGGQFLADEHKAVLTGEVKRVRTPVSAGSIIISRMNTPALVGANAYVDEDHPALFLPDRLWALKTNERADCRWLSYFMQSAAFRLFIDDIATGTSGSMKNISKERLLQLQLVIPPLDEQRRIAEVLRSVDDAILAADETLRVTRHVFARVRAELLESARQRFDEIAVANAIAKNKGQKITKLQTSEYLEEGVISIIDQGATFVCGYTDDAAVIWPYGLPVIVFGDHTRILKFVDFPFAIGADGTQCITPAPALNARYLYYALQSLDLLGEGYARHFKLLKEKTIPLPGLPEQVAIAGQLLALEDSIAAAEQIAERHLATKRALMSNLLSGRVRVPT